MSQGLNRILLATFALILAAFWGLPFIYSVWTAFHPEKYSATFQWDAPLTLMNFVEAWQKAPFAIYFLNTIILITVVLVANLSETVAPKVLTLIKAGLAGWHRFFARSGSLNWGDETWWRKRIAQVFGRASTNRSGI